MLEVGYRFTLGGGQNNTYGEQSSLCVCTTLPSPFVAMVFYHLSALRLFTSLSTVLYYLDGYLSMMHCVTSLASHCINLNSVKSVH